MRITLCSENVKRKRPLGRQRKRWDCSINIGETEFKGVDLINLAEDRKRMAGNLCTCRKLTFGFHKRKEIF